MVRPASWNVDQFSPSPEFLRALSESNTADTFVGGVVSVAMRQAEHIQHYI